MLVINSTMLWLWVEASRLTISSQRSSRTLPVNLSAIPGTVSTNASTNLSTY